MSARQQLEYSAAPAFASTPIFMHSALHRSGAVPGGQTQACTFPVISAQGEGPFSSYPHQSEDDSEKQDDEQLLYTYASFCEEPVTGLQINKHHEETWTLSIEVPIPSIDNPTLLGMNYMIKYATTCDNGNSTIQTDTILTTETMPTGVQTKATMLGVYEAGASYSPLMISHDKALRLSTTLAVKSNGGGEQWSHYVDNQRITPSVRVVEDDCHLYLVFHVCEYPTAATIRSLSVVVSSTWQREEVELKAIEEAERKAKEEADKKAKDEAERKAREEEERQARTEEKHAREEEEKLRTEQRKAWEEEEQARTEQRKAWEEEEQARAKQRKVWEEEASVREQEKLARDEEKRARDEEKRARDEEKLAREQERLARDEERRAREKEPKISVANAPDVADKAMQNLIAQKVNELGLKKCDAGYEYVKTEDGYQCTGGSHKITWKQLGIKK